MYKNMNIYFVRHGQTETNVKKIWNGKTDLPLSKIGLHQSKELVVFFKNTRIDVIYSSPLIRARKTASPLAKSHKLKVIIDERLSERNFGSLELKPTISKDIYDMSN
jgi:broad specificity phosphatase PhoE